MVIATPNNFTVVFIVVDFSLVTEINPTGNTALPGRG
jgi:hypothetical protein